MTNTANVCERCHTSTQNDDWTWIDLYSESPEDSQEYYDELTTLVSTLSGEWPESSDRSGGYFLCWICSENALGTAFHYQILGD